MNQNCGYIFPKKLLLRAYGSLKHSLSTIKITYRGEMKIPVRNEQRCCSAAKWLQEALQKSCKSAGLQQPQILAAVESSLTAINSAFAAVQKIPESRSALQSGCKVASKRQRMLLLVMAYHSSVQKKKCRLQ